MIKATIKKLNGEYLDHGNFQSEEKALEWFQPFIDKGVYGKKHVPAKYEDQTIIVSEAVLDEEGNEITPAIYETVSVLVSEEIQSEFVIEIEDITEQLITENTSRDALQFLNQTDWKILRHLDQQSLGIETSLTSEEFQELLQQRQLARETVIN